MNIETGRIYELGEDLVPKQSLAPGFLTSSMFMEVERPLSEDEFEAARDVARGQLVTRVSGDVAQTMKLGHRERERRERRRRAAKQARKRNR